MKLQLSKGEGNALVTRELLPTPDSGRTVSTLDLTLIWAGMAIDLASFATALSFYPQMQPITIIQATFIGYFLIAAVCMFTGEVGLRYGINFPVYSRACFGYVGTHVPGLIRALPCWFWCGFQTYIAATAMNQIMYMITGVSALWVMVILFTLVQVANAAFGVKAMAKFDWLAIPILAVVLAIIMGALLQYFDATIIGVLTAPAVNDTGIVISFPAAVIAICGGWLCVAVNFCDFTRTMKRPKDFESLGFVRRNLNATLAAAIGLSLIASLIMIMGLVSGPLTGSWSPVDYAVVAFEDNIFMLIVCLLAILFASWSTNTAANLMPAANILSNINPKYISYAMACVISGFLSLAMQAWKFADDFYIVQLILAAMVGPICGILISDYFLVRKRKLNVRDLFRADGQYRYAKNVNPAAMITLGLSFIISFFVDQSYAFFIALPFSIFCYWALMKYWIVKKYPQAEIEDPNYQPDFNYDGSDLGLNLDGEGSTEPVKA